MDLNNCLYNQEDEVSLPEFHRKYGKNLPMLVIVVGGYDGATEFDDTPSDTIIRYSRFHNVKRCLALDPKTRRKYISIPVNCKYKFNVIKSHSKKKEDEVSDSNQSINQSIDQTDRPPPFEKSSPWEKFRTTINQFLNESINQSNNPSIKSNTPLSEDHTLAQILDSKPLPVLIQFSENQEIPQEGRDKDGKALQFLVTHLYEEVFIQGNFITDGKIMKQASSFSLCPIISVAPVKGFTDRTQKEFAKYLQKLESYVTKNTVFTEDQCDLSIKLLAPDADEIRDVLKDARENSADTGAPPPPPVRGKSLRKSVKSGEGNDDDDDEDGEAYEVMEQPPPDIDTYRIPIDPPSYVNDRLCQVKPLSHAPDDNDDDDDKEELYEPVDDPEGEYLEPVKTANGRRLPVRPPPPKPAERPKPKPKPKPSYENSCLKGSDLTEEEKDPPVPMNEDSSLSKEEKNVDSPDAKSVHLQQEKTANSQTSGEFNIAEKSMQEIEQVLRVLRLDKYIERFREEMIDGEILAEITVEDFQSEFNFSKLEAMRLHKYIQKGHIPK